LTGLPRGTGTIRGRAISTSTASLLAKLAPATASTPVPGLAWSSGRGRTGDPGHFYRPILESRLLPDGDLLMNRREPERLHLDIPHARAKIESVAAGFVGERIDFGIALSGGDGNTRQKLIRRSDGAALPGSGKQRQPE